MRKPHKLKKLEKAFAHEVPKLSRGLGPGARRVERAGAKPAGSVHFRSVARGVKRVLGVKEPVLFVDSPVAFIKLVGATDHLSEPGRVRRNIFRSYKLSEGGGSGTITKDGRCVVYVDREAASALAGFVVPVRTERDATDFNNSSVAHEVAEILFLKSKRGQQKRPSKPIEQFIGRFFELDYLLRRNPKMGESILESMRQSHGTRIGELLLTHDADVKANRLVLRLFESAKSSPQRRQIVRSIFRSDLQTPKQAADFITQQAQRKRRK